MTRAERRRQAKASLKNPTYNLTRGQLDQVREDGYADGVRDSLLLMMTLPLEVLMDHYWPKSYQQRLPGFVERVLAYYERWQDGELDMDRLREDLWVYGGVRFEKGKEVVG